MSRRIKKLIFIVPVAIVAMLVVTVIGGELVKLLWNWLLPSLFGFRTVTFWEALGLLALCRILFGGLGMKGNRRSRLRDSFRDRWDERTPEEREQLRQKIRERVLERCSNSTSS